MCCSFGYCLYYYNIFAMHSDYDYRKIATLANLAQSLFSFEVDHALSGVLSFFCLFGILITKFVIFGRKLIRVNPTVLPPKTQPSPHPPTIPTHPGNPLPNPNPWQFLKLGKRKKLLLGKQYI